MIASTRRPLLAGIITPLLLVIGCARGADEVRVRRDLQERLNRDVRPDLFEVVALRREGSAPMPAGPDGQPRVIVYFNTTLRMLQDYTFGGWDQLGPSSLAYALGATEKGLLGMQPQNRAGDLVRAYGSAIYEQAEAGWIPAAPAVAAATAAAEPNIDGTAPPSRSKQLIDKLAAMVELPPPGVAATDDAIIADELARASENIERRVKRREQTFTLATGPEGGEYARFGDALINVITQLAPAVKLRQRHSAGSVENAWLLGRGEADYAIVQGDVAAAAVNGEDLFARGEPLTGLRAVGGLFPEAIHVVVLKDSPLRTIADLRGKKVNIGAPASGTRFDALAVLDAVGLRPADLGEACEDALDRALTRLQRHQLDALFVTVQAPARTLQTFALQPGFRLLPITGSALERLVQARTGITALTLPANTYPQQKTAVTTAASAALLLTTADAPPGEVQRVADLVFARSPEQGPARPDVFKVSADSELRGVTIPLHPGAAPRQR